MEKTSCEKRVSTPNTLNQNTIKQIYIKPELLEMSIEDLTCGAAFDISESQSGNGYYS